MSRFFTGFWEATGPDIDDEVATSVKYLDVDQLLDRLRARLESVPPGTSVRIDLIAWGEEP